MHYLGLHPTSRDGEFENDIYIVSDLKPKNVICNAANDIFFNKSGMAKKKEFFILLGQKSLNYERNRI